MRKSRSIRRESIQNDNLPNSQQIQLHRILRHEKLIRAVHSYRRTLEEEQRLMKVRKDTAFEIELRYRRSQTNSGYSFPRQGQDSGDEQIQDEERFPCSARNSTLYDLKSQNQLQRDSACPVKLTLLDSARRVKSLDQYSSNQSQAKLVRSKRLETHQESAHQESTAKLKRSKTLNKNMIKLSPLLAEPTLPKLLKILKTEEQCPPNNILQRLIHKKLITQTQCTPSKKPSLIIRTLILPWRSSKSVTKTLKFSWKQYQQSETFVQVQLLQIRYPLKQQVLIYAGDNPLIQFIGFSEAYMLLFKYFLMERTILSGPLDLNCLVKIQTNRLVKIQYRQGKITQPNIRSQLLAKYPEAEIKIY